ncbi:hypothetical protein pb186bvf_017304 [Paramecium bursaria]
MQGQEQLIKQLFNDMLQYYRKLTSNDDLPSQDEKVEDIQVCFRIICQIVDSFLNGYHNLQKQYKMLEEQLIKSEQENRKHIRVEQQLKMYAESLQEQYELIQQQLHFQEKSVQLKKKPERINTEGTHERLYNLLAQQKMQQTIPVRIKKRTPTQETIKHSISQQNQYSTIERTIDTKKKKPIRPKSNTIHVTDQPTKSRQKSKKHLSSTSFHY